MSARRLSLVALAALLVSCGRATEVEVLSRARSPDGLREATVEQHIYGPHLGGETPAIEVHIRSVQPDNKASGLVFQAPLERNTVSVEWLGANRLAVTHSSNVPVGSLSQSCDGVLVEHIAK